MKARTVLLSLLLGLSASSVAQAGSVGTSGTLTGRYGDLWFGPGLLPGDVNNDGKVDYLDYLIVKSNLGTPIHATWANGDFDGDGHVTLSDLLTVEANFGLERAAFSPTGGDQPLPEGNVPEPLTILGLVLGAGGVACYFRKRRLA